MIEINNNVVFVQGAVNGALYDFNSNNVYALNDKACCLINKLINKNIKLSAKELQSLNFLIEHNLYSNSFTPHLYKPEDNRSMSVVMAWLEITMDCNCDCLHCYLGNQHISSKNTLSIQEWLSIIDQLVRLNIQRVVVIGGEPCLHKNICDILKHLSKNDIHTTLFTNATALTNALIDIIVDKNISIKTSLYGHNAKIHDSITNNIGSFETLIKNITLLRAKGVTVDLSIVAMKENQDYICDIRHFVESLGFEYNSYDVIRNVFEGDQLLHFPDKLASKSRKTITEPSFTTSKDRFNSNYFHNSCWFGKIAISETGNIFPCVFERRITYGSLKNSTLSEILKPANIAKFWDLNLSQVESCKDCEFRFACKDCRPLSFAENDLYMKNPRCAYNPYSGTWES